MTSSAISPPEVEVHEAVNTPSALTRVLLVEDEPDIQVIVSLALESLGGMTVRVCDTGSQALACAAEFKPDLILLDVMLPGMDGPTTLRALQERRDLAAIPVIFLTAKAQAHELQQLKSLGALDVIAKPFNPLTLADTIRAIWSRRDAD